MSNESFDINDIVYANNNTRITLKSKKKLDELAAQVAIWNLENCHMSLNKENRLSNSEKPIISNAIKYSNNQLIPLSSNVVVSRNYNRRSIIDCKGAVKEKKAFFESLTLATSSDKKSLHTKDTNFPKSESSSSQIIKANLAECIEEIEDISEEVILPPPPYVADNYESECEVEENINLFIKTSSCQSLKNESTLVSELNVSGNFVDTDTNNISSDLTRVSSLTGSLYDEFIYEFEKISNEKDLRSLPDSFTKNEFKKVRRSLSFNDKIKYIELSTDDSSEFMEKKSPKSVDLNETVNSNKKSYQCGSDSQNNIFLDKEIELESLKSQIKYSIEELKLFSNTSKYRSGDLDHVDKCLDIAKNNLKFASLVESVNQHPKFYNGIISDIDVENIRLTVKDDYVFFNFLTMISRGYGEKINKVSNLFHVVLLSRALAGSVVNQSDIFTIVKRKDADKHGLDYHGTKSMEMFSHLEFLQLRPDFKLIFELYCMHIQPKKHDQLNKGTPKRQTPMKKLFCDSPAQIGDSPFLFTNIGTINLTSADFRDTCIEKTINFPQSSPFVGKARFKGYQSFDIASNCEGRLNVYMDVGGVGAWAFRDCKVSHTGIIGGRKSEINGNIEDIDIKIPFNSIRGTANLCEYQVCAKANSFSVLLFDKDLEDKMPVNRRISTDGKKKCRFLSAAESPEDALRWCKRINECYKSFKEWSENI